MTAGIKNYKSIIKKNKKNDKILLLTKAKLNNIKISHISYNQFVSVNMLRKYDDIKEAIKNVKSQTVH